jgi:hypothetical protein
MLISQTGRLSPNWVMSKARAAQNQIQTKFSGRTQDQDNETPDEKALRLAMAIIGPVLTEPLGQPETTFFSHNYRRPWPQAIGRIIVPTLTVNGDRVITYNRHPVLDLPTQIEMYRSRCEAGKKRAVMTDFHSHVKQTEPTERLYVTNKHGHSARLTACGTKLILDFEPLKGKLRPDLPIDADDRDVIRQVLGKLRDAVGTIEKRLADAKQPIPKLGSFRDVVLPLLLKQIERGDIIDARDVIPHPYSDIASESRFEVVAKTKTGTPKGHYHISRIVNKTDNTTHWTFFDRERLRSFRFRCLPNTPFPNSIDRLSPLGLTFSPIRVDRHEFIPKHKKTRRAGQRKLDQRLERRFAETEIRLMTALAASKK